MVRLIAADMDGTLLNSRKELPPHFFMLLDQLKTLGVSFAVASGRQYYTLLQDFQNHETELDYICENGGLIFHRGECIYADEMDAAMLRMTILEIRKIPHAHIALCGVESAYYESANADFVSNMELYYHHHDQVEDLLDVLGQDKICKIAVFDETNAETNIYPRLLPFSEQYRVSLSGQKWVDLMSPHVNKGAALSLLQTACGVGPGECMAFGDYLNDLEMMQSCVYSFAMANAHPDLKAVCRFETQSNDENGVVRAIERYFGIG